MKLKIKKYIYVLRNIKWKGTKTELIELIYALYQARLVENLGRHNCKNAIVHNMAEFFGVEGIDNHTSIHSNSIRKIKFKHLLHRLNITYSEYVEKLINEDHNRKRGKNHIVAVRRNRKYLYNSNTDLRETDAEIICSKSGIKIMLPPNVNINRKSKEFKAFKKEVESQAEKIASTLKIMKKVKE